MSDRGRQGILHTLQKHVGRYRRRGGTSSGSEQRGSRPEDFASIGIPVVYVNPDGTPKE